MADKPGAGRPPGHHSNRWYRKHPNAPRPTLLPTIHARADGTTTNIVNELQLPWYESTLLWGALSAAIAIVLTVVAAMTQDLRWLLIIAWPFFCLFVWAFFKTVANRSVRNSLTVIFSLLIAGGLHWLNGQLVPHNAGFLQLQQVQFFVDPRAPQYPLRVNIYLVGEVAPVYAYYYYDIFVKESDEGTVGINARTHTIFRDEALRRYEEWKAERPPTNIEVGHRVYNTWNLKQEDVDGITSGKKRLYAYAWARWRGGADDLDQCSWLQQTSLRNLINNDIVWHNC